MFNIGNSKTGLLTALSTGVTGITNTGIVVLVQLGGGLSAVGGLGVAMVPQAVCLSVSRALSAQISLRGYSLRKTRHAILVLIASSFIGSAATAFIIMALDLPFTYYSLLLALPFGVAQDLGRQVAFGERRAGSALVSDCTWLTFMLLSFPISSIAGLPLISSSLLGYGIGAAVSLGLLIFLRRKVVKPASPTSVWPLVMESASIFGFAQVATVMAGFFFPLDTIGLARFSLTLVTPVSFYISYAISRHIPRAEQETLRPAGAAGNLFIVSIGLTVACMVAVSIGLAGGILSGPPKTAELLACIGAWGVGLGSGGAITVIIVFAREAMNTRDWLPARLIIAALEPIVMLGVAASFGSIGLCIGPVAANGAYAFFLKKRRLF